MRDCALTRSSVWLPGLKRRSAALSVRACERRREDERLPLRGRPVAPLLSLEARGRTTRSVPSSFLSSTRDARATRATSATRAAPIACLTSPFHTANGAPAQRPRTALACDSTMSRMCTSSPKWPRSTMRSASSRTRKRCGSGGRGGWVSRRGAVVASVSGLSREMVRASEAGGTVV